MLFSTQMDLAKKFPLIRPFVLNIGLFSALVVMALAVVSRPAVANQFDASGFPEHVHLERQVFGSDGLPLTGTHDLTLTYFDTTGVRLFAETQAMVTIVAGRLSVELGSGQAATNEQYETLAAVFAQHPEVAVEFTLDDQVQTPRIGIIPAGHSLKSRLVAAGVRDEGDDDEHWKHYTASGGVTAAQSAVLTPAGPQRTAANASDNSVRRRPYTLPVVGPFKSKAVRDLPIAQRRAMRSGQEVNPPRHESMVDEKGRPFGTTAKRQNDPLVASAQAPSAQTPALGTSFEGVGNISGVLPPDTEGAVGPNHYVQVVNLAFAIFNKNGTKLTGPVNTNTLWDGFGGNCESDNSGDAIFLYDEAADRWVLSQFAVASNHQTVCFAVSQTPDPTGNYFLYEVETPRFPDYYKLGVWPDSTNNAYFMGTNSGFQGAYDVFALDRENMIIGAPAEPMQYFQNFVNLMMPADLDAWFGGTGAPPQDSPGLFYTIRDGGEPYFGSPATDSIDIWAWEVDWTTPANSTLTRIEVITPTDGLSDFNWTLCGFFEGNCDGGNAIPQPGTTQKLDSASWWPMQRLVYQNYGSYESLFGAWTVDVLASGDRAAPRWFELRNVGGGWYIYQQGTHSPDAIHRWMPSIAADISGNIALGYSRGDGSNYASVYYATRETIDPLGTLQAEALLHAGTGSQTSTSGRWGDYASMELDPADGCTFWFTTEYLASTGNAPWKTQVGAFSIPSCGGPRFTVACTPSAFTSNQGSVETSTCTVSALNGFSAPVTLSCSGLPAGVTCGFGINSSNPTYDSTLTITTGATTTLGNHVFDVEATGDGITISTPIRLMVNSPGSNGAQDAVYDPAYQAPSCLIAGTECDSLGLLDGRANLGPEANQPNTIDSCIDGASGTYHSDESIDQIVVRSLDFSNLIEGATVEVAVNVWAWSTGSSDTLDLYYTADATNLNWVYITSLTPSGGGAQTLTAQYTLPAGNLQAVRANFRYSGSQSPCSEGNYDDADDLVFLVNAVSQCGIDADCDNGLYCDGAEVCDAGVCQTGAAPVCEDSQFCNGTETCNEGTDSCNAGTPPVCDDGAFCNGTETCNEGTDSCDAGIPKVCDDGLFCNGTDTCNEDTDSCDAGTPPACDDGAFCNGTETCNESTDSCDAGNDPCVGSTCNESNDVCAVTSTVHVTSVLVGTLNSSRGAKYGTATVTLADNLSNPVGSNFLVEGFFGEPFNQIKENPTDSSGEVFFQTTGDPLKGVTVTFCVSNVDGTGASPQLVYQPGDNEPGATCGALQVCGNSVIEGSEVCDTGELGGAECTDFGFTGGTLQCADTCDGFDTSQCIGEPECVATHSKEKGPRCSDSIDNDCDELIDGDDPDC